MNKLAHGTGHHQKMHHFTDSNSGYAAPHLKPHMHTLFLHTASTDTHKCKLIWIGSSPHTEQLIYVGFASKTLTDVETWYANIECECLSVVFGLEKFHTNIFRCHIMVCNDHKLLEMIQKKAIHVTPLFTKNASQTTKMWLQHHVEAGKRNGLDRPIKQVPFKKRKLTNRTVSQHTTCQLYSRQDQHNKRKQLRETLFFTQFTASHSMGCLTASMKLPL